MQKLFNLMSSHLFIFVAFAAAQSYEIVSNVWDSQFDSVMGQPDQCREPTGRGESPGDDGEQNPQYRAAHVVD